MKKLTIFCMVILGAILLGGCTGGSEGNPQGTQPEKVDSTEHIERTTQTFKMNESIQLGDYIITVLEIEDPYIEDNQFSQPDEGNKFIAVEVTYENPAADKTIDYNPFDWTLYDSEGYSFEQTIFGSKEPDLSSGTLNSGRKVKGWLTFEVPSTSSNFTIQFAPSWLSSDNAEINLF